MFCNDTLLTMLKSYGYNAVRLPKADIRPLQILEQRGRSLANLGDLSTLLVQGAIPMPPISPDTRAANISGQRSSNLKLGLGLSVLTRIVIVGG